MMSVVAGHAALTAAPAAGALLCLRAARHSARGAVSTWLLLAAAAGGVALGQILWAWRQLVLQEPMPFPSTSFYLFVLFHALFSAALLRSLMAAPGGREPRLELAQDAMLACGAIALVLLRFIYEPMQLARPGLTGTELFWILTGQFVAMFSVVSAIVVVIWRRTLLPPRTAALLALVAIMNVVANLMTVQGLDPNAGSPGDVFDFVWLATWGVFGAAAWSGTMTQPAAWTGRAARVAGEVLRRSLSPMVALALTGTALHMTVGESASPPAIAALVVVGLLLALRLAVTLGAADRERRTEQELERTRVLVELSRTLAAAPGVDQALGDVSNAAHRLLRGRVWVELLTANGVVISTSHPDENTIEIPLHSSCAAVLGGERTLQWLTRPDRTITGPDGDPLPPRSWVGCAGVQFGEHIAGCLVVKRRGRGFDTSELELLGALADQAAVAVEHARLLEEARESERSRVRSERLAGLGQLAAGVAHEINNPLAAILSAASLLEHGSPADDQSQAVGIIRKEAARAARIVRGMLDFVRPPASDVVSVSIREVVQGVVESRREEQARQGIVMTADIAEDAAVVADPGLLEQVLINLVVNAEHALEQSNRERSIDIQVRMAGNEVVIRVRDTGTGIAAENLGRIFDPFFTTKDVGRGTGLGLSISYGIVSEMGGTINVQSAPGAGTTFTLRLPAYRRAATPAQDAVPGIAATTSPGPSEQRGERLRVLVVDDEASIRHVLLRFFTRRGYEVGVAEHGGAALDALARGDFDVIVTDLKMPVMDGERLYEELAALPGDLQQRVIFVSGDTVAAATRQFLDSTGRPIISKPFDVDELVAAVEAVAARG